jgi:hypothetical protein
MKNMIRVEVGILGQDGTRLQDAMPEVWGKFPLRAILWPKHKTSMNLAIYIIFLTHRDSLDQTVDE